MQKDKGCTCTEAHQRGGETELLFFTAMQAPQYQAPYWFYELRHAPRQDDRDGIDAYAYIDKGQVPVQIKTSHAGRLDHLERYGDQHCIIVICPTWPILTIRRRSFDLLYQWRGRLIRPQRRAH